MNRFVNFCFSIPVLIFLGLIFHGKLVIYFGLCLLFTIIVWWFCLKAIEDLE